MISCAPRRRPARTSRARKVAALLALGLPSAVSGCGSERLWLTGPETAALGEVSVFAVSADLPCGGKVFGGPSDPTGDLMVCSRFHQITKVAAAACDDDACVVESLDVPDTNGFRYLNVVGNTAGPTVLRVRAELDDGSQMSASSPVSFATPTGMHVACYRAAVGGYPITEPFGACGGYGPVFTDEAWFWASTFASDAGPLPVYQPTIGIQGGAVTYDASTYIFQSGSTVGSAVVTVSTRQFSEDVPVRVVSPADVVSGELRLVTLSDGVEQPIAELGPLPSALWFPPQNGQRFDGDVAGTAILPRLALADGSQVYGGAGLLVSDHPEVCGLDSAPAGANPLQQTFVDLHCSQAGSATLSATVGAATITVPLTAGPPPASP
jgi:hypothetical protein